jgi:dihydroorotate dehydrogenase (NAD+) catalytic subunit
MILAGATAIQVGTASFINPLSMLNILEGIKNYMVAYGVEDISELIGKVVTPSHEIEMYQH